MPRRCTVCDSPKRAEIDRALVARADGYRNIAERFRLSLASVYRHYAEHLPAALAKAQGARDAASGERLLDRLLALHGVTLGILKEARKTKSHGLALAAIQRAEKQLELQARLMGELQDAPSVNILVTAEFRQVQAVIIETLRDHPALRSRVAAALLQVAGAEAAA
ncbi:MAG: hypothetical protein WKG32_08385 [Gemmatimonadaceae bacterium]